MKRLLLLLLPIALCAACGNATTENDSTDEPIETGDYVPHAEGEYGMTHEEYEELAAQSRPPQRGQLVDGQWQNGADELDYVLTLKEIGDGAYPSFSVSALPEKASEPVSFYLNAEDYKGTSINELMNNIGKPVRIVYYIRTQNHITGTVVNEHATNKVALEGRGNEKTITGKWIATAESQGDLPDNIYLETANGLRVAFPAFISKEDVALNGKTVTVNYVTDEDMVISYIKLMKE